MNETTQAINDSTMIEKFDPSKLMDGVKDRIKSTFVSLIPDGAWEAMVEKEIYVFTTGRIELKSEMARDENHNYIKDEFRWEPKVTNDKGGEHMCVFNLKYFDRHTDYALLQPCANFGILRYADVLLNYAEAANLLKAGDGLAELNMIRKRAGLEPFSGDQAAIDNEILNQRRYEFVGEAKVYFDELRKDKIAEFAADKCKRGVEEGIIYISDLVFKASKNYLFKIPQGDLDGNKALEQNPDNVSK